MSKCLKKPLLLLGVLLFILFVVFSYFVQKNLFTQLDFNTTVKLQNDIPRTFDMWFSFLSLLGSAEIVSIILLILWPIIKRMSYFLVLFIFGVLHVLEFFGKAFVYHPGPPHVFVRYDLGFSFPSSFVQPGSSYPSGHLARTVFIGLILLFMIHKLSRLPRFQKNIITGLIMVFVGLMFVSRIYLGEHWLSDVIGGTFLGGSSGLLALSLL